MSTVDTSTIYYAINDGNQRKSFYAAGLFWAFYNDGTNAGWEFSADGTTWAGAFTSIGACTYGYDFSIWFDGTYVYYVRSNNFDLFYRRGVPEDDGTITWSAAEQTVYDGGVGDEYKNPCICVDTNGFAWIGAYNDQLDGDNFPVVLKNSENDGTWVTEVGFDPYELSAVDDETWQVSPVPLTGGKVYVVYCRRWQEPHGRLYDAGWGADENDLADYDNDWPDLFSVVALGDNVHFVYLRDITSQIRHNERVWGAGWNVNDVLVHAVNAGPVLSVDPSSGDLYCFWALSTTEHVYYKRYSGGSWDADPTDWIDETTDEILIPGLASSFYMDYGYYIGLLYITETDSPYKVRFAFLRSPFPPKEGFSASDRLAMLIKAGVI